jgi:hypothetical protein
MQNLTAILDRGKKLPFPDGILINGRGPGGAYFNVEQGTISFQIYQILSYMENFCFTISFSTFVQLHLFALL